MLLLLFSPVHHLPLSLPLYLFLLLLLSLSLSLSLCFSVTEVGSGHVGAGLFVFSIVLMPLWQRDRAPSRLWCRLNAITLYPVPAERSGARGPAEMPVPRPARDLQESADDYSPCFVPRRAAIFIRALTDWSAP